jgi:hypothetical protein
MKTLTHRVSASPLETHSVLRPVIVQINLDVSLLFWPLYALLWLGWLALRSVGRTIRRLYEIARAIIVVSGRRVRRWLRRNEQRIEWVFSGLVYGPMMGVG